MFIVKRTYCNNNNTQGEGLVIANLGDSRAVMGTICDEKLIATQLTTDLKPELPRKILLINYKPCRFFF